MIIDAKETFLLRPMNKKINSSKDEYVRINNCLGQRYLGAGAKNKKIDVYGTPGNALGAYLDGATITVHGNAQDAVGDTMNDGKIIIEGNAGDALGYAMRGGKIFVAGNAGYRAGVHIKEYRDKKPIIVIGGLAGSFLGEYMAGGRIVVLNLNDEENAVGNFTGAGMHGGKIFIRGQKPPKNLPAQVKCDVLTEEDLIELKEILKEFAILTDISYNNLSNEKFTVLKPDTANPYKTLYVSD